MGSMGRWRGGGEERCSNILYFSSSMNSKLKMET